MEIDSKIEIFHEYELLEKQIIRAEHDLNLWQILCDHATETSYTQYPNEQTLAQLFSPLFGMFNMRSAQIRIGRSKDANLNVFAKKNNQTDSDIRLNLLSRQHCVVCWQPETSHFYIVCLMGVSQPLFVDGKCIMPGCRTRLYDKSIIEIGNQVLMLFLINYSYANKIKIEKMKNKSTENKEDLV